MTPLPAQQRNGKDKGLSIDHVAIPRDWQINSVEHIVTQVDGKWLSDHDAYVVDV